MTNRVEEYAAAINSFAVVYRNFLLWSSRRKNHFLCAFEGQDHFYYDSRVRTLIPELQVSHFHMGGRTNVLDLLNISMTNKSLANLMVAYFVDRDYQAPDLEHPCLYVTPGYAIENHYVSRECLRRILCSCFDLRELIKLGSNWRENDELEKIVDFCSKALDTYGMTIGAQLNAFLSAAYRSAKSKGLNHHGLATKEFDEKKFGSLFNIDESGLKVLQEVNYDWLLGAFQTTAEAVDRDSFESTLKQLNSCNSIQYGRGKFLFAVLLRLIDFLRSDGRRTKPKLFTCKHPCKIDESDIPLASFSNFADTPIGLNKFLSHLRTQFGLDTQTRPRGTT